jgi:hypothetical protein
VILCDTAGQIEQAFTLQADDKIEFDDAIKATNIQAGEDQCVQQGDAASYAP